MTNSAKLTEQGIAALKSGDKVLAYKLLTQSLSMDAKDELAWLWLSGVVQNNAERRYCLEKVVEINPNNEAARRGLLLLPPDIGSRSPFSSNEILISKLTPETLTSKSGPESEPNRIQQHNQRKSRPVIKALRLSLFAVLSFGLLCWLFVLNGIESFIGENEGVKIGSSKVTLHVTGSVDRAFVTYGSVESQSQEEVLLPWSKDIDVPWLSPISLIAQNTEDGGHISCKITKGSKIIEEARSRGAYVVVACSGIP